MHDHPNTTSTSSSSSSSSAPPRSQTTKQLVFFYLRKCINLRNSSTATTIITITFIFLIALLTRNLYTRLTSIGGPLHARVAEDNQHLHDEHGLKTYIDKGHHDEHETDKTKKSSASSRYDPLDSKKYRNAKEPMADRSWLDDAASLEQSDKTCVCPQITHCRDDKIEMGCLNYLSQRSNVESIKFDGSITKKNSHRRGRAPMLFIQYKDSCVKGIAKLRSELLPLAPESEFLSYHVDRAMHFSHIPPTTILFLPVAKIEASASTPEEKKWLQRMVIGPARKRKAIVFKNSSSSTQAQVINNNANNDNNIDPEASVEFMYVSVQLMIYSARSATNTPLEVSDAFTTILRYDVLYQRTIHHVVEMKKNPASREIISRRKHQVINLKPLRASDISLLLNDFVEGVQNYRKKKELLQNVNNEHQQQNEFQHEGIELKIDQMKQKSDNSNENNNNNNNNIHVPNLDHLNPNHNNNNKEDMENKEDIVQDYQQKSEAITEEAKNLEEALHNSDLLAHPETFNNVLNYMSDRAVFDAVVASDVSGAIHGGEAPLQSSSARVYILRYDQVPESCFDWSERDNEGLVRLLPDGRVQYVLATTTDKDDLLNSIRRMPGGGNVNSNDNDKSAASLRFLMPLWIQNEGAFRRRKFLTPNFRGTDPSVTGSVCLMSGRTFHVLRKAAQNRAWKNTLSKRVHAKILERFSSEQLFDWPQIRLQHMLDHQLECKNILGPEHHWLVW